MTEAKFKQLIAALDDNGNEARVMIHEELGGSYEMRLCINGSYYLLTNVRPAEWK